MTTPPVKQHKTESGMVPGDALPPCDCGVSQDRLYALLKEYNALLPDSGVATAKATNVFEQTFKSKSEASPACSKHGRPIAEHPAATAGPTRATSPRQRNAGSSASPTRRAVLVAYGETCPVTGETSKNCHAAHLFRKSDGESAFTQQFRHLKNADLDSTKNVVLVRSDLNDTLERFELAFEPRGSVPGDYTAYVPLDDSKTLNSLRGVHVKLVADPAVLAWHLSMAQAKKAAVDANTSGSDGDSGNGGDADKKGDRKGGDAGKKGKKAGKKGGGSGKKAGKTGGDGVDCGAAAHDDEQDLTGYAAATRCRIPVHKNTSLTGFNLALNQVML